MKNWIYLLILCSGIFMSSCSNELDIAGPHTETVVVYGLLNASDSVHYIKINKGFISENETPIQLAKDPDQLFFDSLEVKVLDLTDGTSSLLEKENIQKDTGIFNNSVNYIFILRKKLTANHQYRLEVYNPLTGKKVNAETNLVGPSVLQSPSTTTINFFDIEPPPANTFLISFNGAKNARSYEIQMRLYYEEIDQSSSTIEKKSVTWNVSSGNFNDLQRVSLRLSGQLFYDFLASKIEVKPANIARRGLYLEVEYWTADEVFTTYRDVFGNSGIGIVQKKTDYTNVNGGYGVFASRNNMKITGQTISSRTKEQLKRNKAMGKLNFID